MASVNDHDDVGEMSSQCLWPVDDMNRLRRILCLGVESCIYTCHNSPAAQHMECIHYLINNQQGLDVVREIEDFSKNGRTAKQQPLLLALAVCTRSKDLTTKQAAYAVLPEICRIPTHLFLFVKYVEDLGKGTDCESTGWGRALRRAVTSWYLTKDPKQLALFVTKYKQRNGWSHKDLLRLSHVNPGDNQAIALVLQYVTRGWKKTKETYVEDGLSDELKSLLKYFDVVETVKHASIEEGLKVAALIAEYQLVREHVPTWLLKSKEVWRALLPNMPASALLRSLSRLSSLGLLPADDADYSCVQLVVDKLRDSKFLEESRLHPINILFALESYKKGSGEKGKKLKWTPNHNVIEALHHAFCATFKNVEPTGKKFLICIDVSKSMEFGSVLGSSQLSPALAAAAMATVMARTEPHYLMMAFSSSGLTPVKVTPEMTVEEVCQSFSAVEKGSKDSAAPIEWADKNKQEVDVFVLFTDDKSWPVKTPPAVALRKYRKAMNIEHARLVMCSLTASKLTMADPQDAGMLDIVGFDSAIPQIISNFAAGRL